MRYSVFIILVIFINCTGGQNKTQHQNLYPNINEENTIKKEGNITETNLDTLHIGKKNEDNRKITILVIQCSNGYEYSMFGYDFNPIIERELRRIENIEVIPFSLKKLMGVTYQGVYDRKYCKPILDKVDADYYIMTRFTGEYPPDTPNMSKMNWGYETKVLNTKSMQQIISIGNKRLNEYREIEIDIMKNIPQLVKDIKSLK
jgi:hypothetical protein